MAKVEPSPPPRPGERRLTESGRIEVFDGERWVPDLSRRGDSQGTPIRDGDNNDEHT